VKAGEFFALAGLSCLAVAFIFVACGGNPWTDADSKSAHDAVTAGQALVQVCGGDAACDPGIVRATERSVDCNIASMLHRHGADLSDAGAGCSH
jgi:hypothetical protein